MNEILTPSQQIVDTLEAAHEEAVIERDLKRPTIKVETELLEPLIRCPRKAWDA